LLRRTIRRQPNDLNVQIDFSPECQEIVILGVTQSGDVFRPSDWAERLCGVVSHFSGDQRLCYSPYATPIVADGIKCVVIDARLRTSRPDAFEFLIGFARDNDLLLRNGREEPRADTPNEHIEAAEAAVSVTV
jgi:uncharacterized protein DUF3579